MEKPRHNNMSGLATRVSRTTNGIYTCSYLANRLATRVLTKKCKIRSTWAWAGSRDLLFKILESLKDGEPND